jgi:hypothetical protein
MVRKTQIKKKKSKSQLRKTLKHYSKTNKNKKGGGKTPKDYQTRKNNQTMTAPPVNTFANGTGVKRNPLYKRNTNTNTNNQYNPQNNSNLPNGFVRNNALMEELYGKTGIVYNTEPEEFKPDQSYMPMYPPKNTKYYNLSKNTPGERQLTRNGNANSSSMYSNVFGNGNNNNSNYLYVGHQNSTAKA